jgi:hypothetical protein
LNLEGITIDESDFTSLGSHENVGLVHIAHDYGLLVQAMERSRDVPSHINQTLPCGIGEVLISINWSVEQMYTLSRDSGHKEAHRPSLVVKEEFLRPCGYLSDAR